MTSTRTESYGGDEAAGPRVFRAAYLVLGLECLRPLASSARFSIAEVTEITLGRGQTRRCERGRAGDGRPMHIEVPDSRVSARHARMIKTPRGWMLVDEDSKNGTFLNGKVIDARTLLADGDLIEVGGSLLLFRDAVAKVVGQPGDLATPSDTTAPLPFTLSPPLAVELRRLTRAARVTDPVLIHNP